MSGHSENGTAFVPIHSSSSKTKGPCPHMTYTIKIIFLGLGVCALASLFVSALFIITRLTASKVRAKKASDQDTDYRF
jgi:hypothetical protein